jgi:uncharacterized membrane protein (DUF4010 family)
MLAASVPLVVVMLWMVGIGVVYFLRIARRPAAAAEHQEPPTELNGAILFGVLYAAVLFAVAVAKDRFGDRALFVVAALSGLTDMDAITLSTAQLVNAQRLDAAIGWRLILVGAMANLVFKGAMVAALGNARLRSRVAILFGLSFAGAAAVLWLWPA